MALYGGEMHLSEVVARASSWTRAREHVPHGGAMCTASTTASHCDLRDPGWGDPGSLHCDFFAWHLSAHPMMFLVCPSVASMDGLLGTRHISCLVIAFFTSTS